jgi:hypothetical protein
MNFFPESPLFADDLKRRIHFIKCNEDHKLIETNLDFVQSGALKIV